MAEAVQTRVRADEFFEMEFPGERAELVRGEVIRMSPGGGEHGIIDMNIGGPLWAHVRANRLGVVCGAETGFLVARDPDTVRAPDVAFVSNERMGDMARPRKYWPFAPDLAVEVVFPNDAAEEIEQKVGEWLASGTQMVWVLYPATRRIHVHRSPADVKILEAGDTLTGEEVVPGFSYAVAEVFE